MYLPSLVFESPGVCCQSTNNPCIVVDAIGMTSQPILKFERPGIARQSCPQLCYPSVGIPDPRREFLSFSFLVVNCMIAGPKLSILDTWLLKVPPHKQFIAPVLHFIYPISLRSSDSTLDTRLWGCVCGLFVPSSVGYVRFVFVRFLVTGFYSCVLASLSPRFRVRNAKNFPFRFLAFYFSPKFNIRCCFESF